MHFLEEGKKDGRRLAFPAGKVYAHVTENHLASACTHAAEFARPGGATHEPPPAAHALVQLWPLLPNCQWALPQWSLAEPWDSLRTSGSWSACAWLLIGDGDQRCFARRHLSTAELVRFESCDDISEPGSDGVRRLGKRFNSFYTAASMSEVIPHFLEKH